MEVDSNYEMTNYKAFGVEYSPNYEIEKDKDVVNNEVNKFVLARE